MLTHLSIQNLTLVEQLELEFAAGMSVITGETGAGKSILLGALGLALGDRADSSLIGPGSNRAEICASFDLRSHPDATAWLETKELGEDDHCILRRVVSRDGRSRAFVNGSAMTLAELKDLSEMLMDIHSQHEHQSLLKKDSHAKLLDEFGGLSDVVLKITKCFDAMTGLTRELSALKTDAEEKSARVQLLSYQVEELNNLALATGELEQLEQEQKRLSSADETKSNIEAVISLCSKESDESASSLASRALSLITAIDDELVKPVKDMLESAVIQLDEAMADLTHISDNFDADAGRLTELERRLDAVYDIARKHRVNPETLPELNAQLQQELDQILNADVRIGELEKEAAAAEKQYLTQAEKLSSSRTKTARLLESEVTEQLQALGMGGAAFSVSIKPAESAGRTGMDDLEFLISTIPGAEPGSLNKIASGGELSRISLAIQVITAKTSKTPTLIFDEVDVGVGGATAEVVGSLLRKLSASTQIVCVTHLPQVAAQGHQHYVVAKSTTSTSAETTVIQLDEEEKVEEIARMLGGIEQTDESLAHAQSMISGNR